MTVVLSAAALAGCAQPAPENNGPVKVTTYATITADDAVPPPPADPSAASSGGIFDASTSLTTTSCQSTGGSWSFEGTLKNTDTEAHNFSVAIFLLKSDMTQAAMKELTVQVPAGGQAPVVVKDFYTGPSDGLQCTTGVTVKED